MTEGIFRIDAVKKGEKVSDVLRRAGVALPMECGGAGLCGKCRVTIEDAPAPCADEKKLLSPEDIKNGVRLACLTDAAEGMALTLPRAPRGERILAGVETECGKEARGADFSVAVDIGTTTVVAYLMRGGSEKPAAVASCMNPQREFGADVISRISYATERDDGLALLHEKIISAINGLIAEITESAGARRAQISRAVISGNTTMEHLFAGVSVRSIGRAPFMPEFRVFDTLAPEKLGLELAPGTPVSLMPNISGFVGGDIVSGTVYTGLADADELSLFIDIGTNNEMVLGSKDFLLCCSAAAGPALEGAKISRGMCAAEGAIDHVRLGGGGLAVSTVGNAPAIGICGSGLVDVVALLLSERIIDPGGKFKKDAEALPGRLDVKNKRWLIDNDVYFTQKDVREVQLAKGAICTGVEIMLAEAGKRLEEVDKIFLAGAFGNYIDVGNASKIGILPKVPREKIIPVGNSSGLGAIECCRDKDFPAKAAKILERAEHIELATHKDFQQIFVRNLLF